MFLATDSDPRRLLRKKLALAYTESYLQNEDIDHLIDLRLENPQPQHAYHAQIAAGVSFNLSEQVEDITAPTLISAATKDLVVPILNAYNLHKKIPNSKLIIYEDLGHQFFVESPRRFNRDVIEFLTGSSQQKE